MWTKLHILNTIEKNINKKQKLVNYLLKSEDNPNKIIAGKIV